MRANPRLIDTHTHFDLDCFDPDRLALCQQMAAAGVQGLILIGYLAQHFPRLIASWQQINAFETSGPDAPAAWLAPGLHPFYQPAHQPDDLLTLEAIIRQYPCVAIGEIGLDTYTAELKQPAVYQAQQQLFVDQLALARQYQLPVLLHIRRAHADVIALLKKTRFEYGGIAHAFSGGIQEARALIRLGFRIGITGQITDPNARKLRQVVQQLGPEHLVLETDCPDMTPLCCRLPGDSSAGDSPARYAPTRNTPANLPAVLKGLAQVLGLPPEVVAEHCWQNTRQALPALALAQMKTQALHSLPSQIMPA